MSTSQGTCPGCKLGFWFDWNGNGTFGEGESYLMPVVAGTPTLQFYIPDRALLTNIYARFRLYGPGYTGPYSPTGMVKNGEVEDYRFVNPTAVELLWFQATGVRRAIKLGWETASEVDNLGFNLYRASALEGPRTKINSALIPTNVPPGSPFGAVYEYTDTTVQGRVTYYYWLEDVDIYGNSTLHGPAQAQAR